MKMLLYLIVAVALFTGWLIGNQATVNAKHQYETQQICDRSHAVNSGSLEQACGYAQDKYHTEYLCQSTKPDSFCWTEVK